MPTLSIVLPCYRSAPLAHRSVERLREYLGAWVGTWEIVVVDDGGGDFAADAFQGAAGVRLLRLPTDQGKGAAVCAGMLVVRGDVRTFTDVDLPYDLDLIPTIATIIRERGFHLVIGDRTLPSSRYVSEVGLGRKIASLLFTGFVGTIVTGGFFDTQCGLKGVRGDVADERFRLIRLQRFAFDVELIYISLKDRLDIHRIPVQLRNNEISSVRLLRDAARGFTDVFRIKWNQVRGCYDSPRLEQLIQREFLATRARAGGGQPSPVRERTRHVAV